MNYYYNDIIDFNGKYSQWKIYKHINTLNKDKISIVNRNQMIPQQNFN